MTQRWLPFLVLLLSSIAPVYAAEVLSTSGDMLEAIHITPDDTQASVSKTIQVDSAQDVSAAYILVRLKSGLWYQKNADGSFSAWDASLDSLVDLGLRPDSSQNLEFNVAEGTFFGALDYPMTVYVGYTDAQGALYYGAFLLTANLQTVSDELWDETAVRKVLHAFAFGGFASDAQIKTWAEMSPAAAIAEIITADPHNEKLSPAANDGLAAHSGTLQELGALWVSDDLANPVTNVDRRAELDLTTRLGAERVWRQAANLRGLNPVRQRLGFWETNYHLSVNLDASVGITNQQMARYYDDIVAGLASDAYQDVLATASLSAAVATQYNHRRNVYDNDSQTFRGNEDFGREFHQIFFGILGYYDTTTHEEVSIKNTAQALTDMPVGLAEDGSTATSVTFGTEQHHQADLEILGSTISGTTAEEKIKALAQVAVEHAESLDNLPIIIARGLGDDNLDTVKTKTLQSSWGSMSRKDLISFLREYAISAIFHSSDRVKYQDSVSRYLTFLNQLTLSNDESYADLYTQGDYTRSGVNVFRPMHDVFGGETGFEAADTPETFRTNYERHTKYATRYAKSENDAGWVKNWGAVMPDDGQGQYLTSAVAEWLWQRFIADGGKNLGTLERFHLYSLLANCTDPAYALDSSNPNAVYSTANIEADSGLQASMESWGNTALALGGDDSSERRQANYCVGLAVNFIAATPFSFVQEGR